MSIFRVTSSAATLIVRAACYTCARRIAVERSPAEEFQAWSQASVDVIRDPENHGYLGSGPTGIIERVSA